MNEPFLRLAPPEGAPPQPCPDGTAAHPVGIWHGRWMEIVYDPTRHDVACLRGGVSPEVADGLRRIGYEHRLTDGANELWVRDRAALARRRLGHIPSAPSVQRIA